ncbi:carboxypeptidase-like regulatory domain-containing protein [Bremerella sp. P1]|uniref:carboxypeptidase-like regulatory domain-containing protein n=1 Tax=Bremerella sp. P1 TaxID=3026424 RepID=UPI002367B42C|nr:carboxypeptidase-like regulatory domain-containing protein [Bremerella sp. P1]WDI42572.1 carboxypeptidase-like regulatory domain-containing protein [Bremerella sp. P1]
MKRLLYCFALILSTSLLGCNGNQEGVTGTVTLDGQPLPKAEVVFTPTEGGRPATAMTDASGKYDLVYTIDQTGAPPGEYVVRIRAARTETGEDGRDVMTPESVPAKYNEQSQLIVEVQEGASNQFDFDLESE